MNADAVHISPEALGRYDPWQGQLNLYDPSLLPLDVSTRALLQKADRVVEAGDMYTLLAFARRASVFAMRERSAGWILDGLSACGAMDTQVVDVRDVLVALATLHHAAGRIDEDSRSLLRAAAERASPAVADQIAGLLRRPASELDLRQHWGLIEVDAPGGISLLRCGFKPYTPARDLAAASVAIAEIVSADQYQADDPELAVQLPEVWLSGAADPALGAILGSVRGAALLHGRLRPSASEHHASQQLTVFLVEVSDTAAASRLQGMVAGARDEYKLLGVARRELFVLVVARSVVQGTPAFEDREALGRFAIPLARVLERVGNPAV